MWGPCELPNRPPTTRALTLGDPLAALGLEVDGVRIRWIR